MTADDLGIVIRGIAPAVRDYVATKLEAFTERLDVVVVRLKALESLPAPKDGAQGAEGPAGLPGASGEKGDRGEQGESGAVGDRGERGEQGLQGLPGEPGVKGDPGERGDPGIAGERGERGERGELGLPGEPGAKGDPGIGERGEKGEPGERGLTVIGPEGPPGRDVDPAHLDALKAEIVELRKELAAARTPPDWSAFMQTFGPDIVKAVTATVEPLIASRVAALPPAKDGIGVMGALLDREGHLVLTLSDGATKDVGLVVGRDVDMRDVMRVITEEVAKFPRPADGIDGKDGLGFDDLDVVYDEARGYLLRFVSGDRVKDYPLHVPHDRGVYRPVAYTKGMAVSFGGSLFVAQRDTTGAEKPEDASGAWRLAVKRGANGKDGKSIKGDPGTNGRDGRDLTAFDRTLR